MTRVNVLNTPLEVTTYVEFTGRCQQFTKNAGPTAIDFTNTHIVTMRRHDESFREITTAFDYFVPDSTPLMWCLRWQGAPMHDRVYGPTFMRHCIVASGAPYTHYFLGGSAECLDRLMSNLREWQPQLQMVGFRDGYFRPDEEAAIVEEINALAPDFVWIGLGTPKQQEWIHRHKSTLRRGVLLAVGFAFDVNAGTKSDAPAWMQRLGLTWLFRVLSEPRRLALRYLRYNTLFLFYLLKDGLRRET